MFKHASSKFTQKFIQLVEEANSIVITAHTSPDDDSVASVLGVYAYMKRIFPSKKTRIIYSGDKVRRYSVFKNYDLIEFVPDMTDHLGNADLLIMLDGSQYSRFTQKPEVLREFKGKTVCIDHHSSPIDKFTLTLVDPTSPSNAEIIYRCFFRDSIEQKEIEIILLGILGDTGVFGYLKPNQLGTFDTAKRLLKHGGIEIQEFLSRYSTIQEKAFEIVRELIKNTKNTKVDGWPPHTFTFITREWFETGKYTDAETSEATHLYMTTFLRTLEGHGWGFVVSPETDGTCGISLRSLPGSVNVRDMMEKMQLGGGHDRAAGGTFKPSNPGERVKVEDCIAKVVKWMEKNQAILS